MNDRVGRDGRARPIDSTAGRMLASHIIAQKPSATLREIATNAGISLGTARDVRQRMRQGRDPVPDRLRGSSRQPIEPKRAIAPGHGEAAGPTLLSERKSTLLLEHLRRDPSLRYSEVGRAVLRLLAVHSMTAEDWDRLIDSVPTHCATAVAQLAYGCAAAWEHFAQELEESPQRRQASGS